MAKYPDTKAAVGAMGVLCRSALRTMPAYSNVIGAALGNIIPTIMMAHIKNMNDPSTISHGRGAMTVLVKSESPEPIEDIEPANTRRYTQAKAVTPAKENTIVI